VVSVNYSGSMISMATCGATTTNRLPSGLQPLGQFNGLSWARRIEPLRYHENQRYVERESIANALQTGCFLV
jgi:hypothetical protein